MQHANPHIDHEELWLGVASVQAWKAARLVQGEHGIGLAGVASKLTYGTHDVARCRRNPWHVPPHEDCRCGFYAWRHRESVTALLAASVPAVVEVELFGRFDEYDYGYVAAGQRVRAVRLLPYCGVCLREGVASGAVAVQQGRSQEVEPYCGRHVSDEATELEVLSDVLGVPVSWLPVTPALEFRVAMLLRLADRPMRYPMGGVQDLGPGDIGYVFSRDIGERADGSLGLRHDARLTCPSTLRGEDVAIRRRRDGALQALLEGVRLPATGWRTATWDTREVEVVGYPVRALAEPVEQAA